MDVSKSEQFYKMRIEELEKQLESRNFKIDSLSKQIKLCSDELTRQTEKHQIVCEARDESKFRVVQLEKDVSVLRKENDNLISQLKEQKIIKNAKELSLEAVVASYADQIKKYEDRIEAYYSKISQLEKKQSASFSEKSFEKQNNGSINEDCLKILHLEKDLKLLSLENEDLKSKLEEEKESKDSRIQTLETHFKSCSDKLQKYEQIIKEYESKIIHLETEKKEMVCRSEAHLSEIKKLQSQLETLQNGEKKLEEVKITIAQHQEELSNLKSSSRNQIQAGTVTRGVFELQECKSILSSFAEQHKNLQMKFEQEMKEKLLQIEETISEERDILKAKSPVNLKDAQLPKAGKPEERVKMVEKEDISTKSQKKGKQKSPNTEAQVLQSHNLSKPKAVSQKDPESQNADKPDVSSNVSQKNFIDDTFGVQELEEKLEKDDSVRIPLKPQNRRPQKSSKTEVKKNTKKNKKIKDSENVCSPTGPKDPISENIKTAVENIASVPNEGRRQLRTRRKV